MDEGVLGVGRKKAGKPKVFSVRFRTSCKMDNRA